MDVILKYFSEFTDTQMDQFRQLEGLYREWNEKINVISRKDIDQLYEKHVLHSLAIAAVADLPDGMQVIDLGTGGGFPGIPLAIFFPEVKFHLVDSIGKKIKVVQGVTEALGLKNVTSAHSRIEDIKDRKFDLVVSRAVAPLGDLWRWSKPVLKKAPAHAQQPGLICLKGGDLTEEIAASGVRPRMTDLYQLFPEDSFKEKYVVVVNK